MEARHTKKGYNIIDIYDCDWWKTHKTDNSVEQHLRESSSYKMPLKEERLLEDTRSGSLFGYVQCDFEVPENLREAFVNFPPVFKNINLGRDDIGPFIKEDAEKEELSSQPTGILISSFLFEKGTIITPLLFFYLDLGLICEKIIALCNTLQWSASTTSFGLQRKLEERETRIQFIVLWLRQ